MKMKRRLAMVLSIIALVSVFALPVSAAVNSGISGTAPTQAWDVSDQGYYAFSGHSGSGIVKQFTKYFFSGYDTYEIEVCNTSRNPLLVYVVDMETGKSISSNRIYGNNTQTLLVSPPSENSNIYVRVSGAKLDYEATVDRYY